MHAARRFVIIGLFLVLTVTGEHAWAEETGKQGGDPDAVFAINSKAKGTQVEGTLNVFFTVTNFFDFGLCGDFGGIVVDMNIDIRARLRNKGDYVTEGEVIHNICYGDITAQRNTLLSVIQTQLLPKLGFTPTTPFEVKDVSNVVQDQAGDGTDTNPLFLMLDFILAVQTQT
jgi:hypothetical protein